MSGREIEKNTHKKKYGLINRLNSHASGRLSGDQFCVYVANRLIIPSLSPSELKLFSTGELTLDSITKLYIHKNFSYQFVIVEGSEQAYRIEALARSGDVFSQQPLLNPLVRSS